MEEKKLTETIKLYEEMNEQITKLLDIDDENPVERYASEYIKHLRNIIADQKAEMERLTEERQTLVDKYNKSDEAVDYWCEKYKKSVKDTAKDILCYLWNIGFEGVDRLSALGNGIQELATKFDVVVE